MFSHALDRGRHPLAERARGIVLGSIITVGVVAALVSARTVAFSYAVAVVAFLLAAWWRGDLADAAPRNGPVARHFSVFLLYALASTAWAYVPATSFPSVFLAIVVALGTIVLIQLFTKETRPNLLHMGEGLWIGFLVGLLYLFVELFTDQSLKIWVYNAIGLGPSDLPHPEYFGWSGETLVFVSREDLTRNMVPVALCMWPAVMAARGTLRRRSGLVVSCLMVLLAGAVIMLAWHETSKLAYLAGVATFAGACVGARLTGRFVAMGWVIACLAVLPSALIAHRLDVHNASWLPSTARHRIIIWNHTAEQVLKAPLLGVGARTTYLLGPRGEEASETRPDEAFARTLSVHSHSVYLQTWFELGLIGATLLTLFGLSILQAIRSLALPLRPYAYATFVSAMVMAASSYGMWQIWFVSMFALTAALFGLGASLIAKRNGHETITSRALEHDATVQA